MDDEKLRCKCGFVAHGKTEASIHMARASHYAGENHGFWCFGERREGERRVADGSQKRTNLAQSDDPYGA